ncbi:hypothetical protein [Prolixibacter sp. NT017]|uniref:hypothetical protein n=1 Tax=Prolixibacter sp. NT017 TaxID=2652390 RepID=UPI00127067E7|nr:hypothetical protein [Prolixibacter sp. NT017]GET26183.1 hypothetical protein NT017_25120 [Prolixibacter sp. NT017]
MLKTDKVFDPEKVDFTEKMAGLSDHDLIIALRKRSDYHPKAAKAAIAEAIQRGIIESEDDLESEEFKPIPFKRLGLFVRAESQKQARGILSSLILILYVFSLIPFLYGGIDIASGDYLMAAKSAILGAFTLHFAYRTSKTEQPADAVKLIIASTLTALFSVYHFWSQLSAFGYMEILVIVVILGLVLFTSINVWQLTKRLRSI